ncbi:hypothetical protein GCM10023169_16960 [Georgenia halophila]|uniref:Cysteinyl-tRNA ligase anticodon binding domain-containing protein n=1 Tax=Georgenia halophila TaxID=620889 RepID=A0ABP8L5B9_9MICO
MEGRPGISPEGHRILALRRDALKAKEHAKADTLAVELNDLGLTVRDRSGTQEARPVERP